MIYVFIQFFEANFNRSVCWFQIDVLRKWLIQNVSIYVYICVMGHLQLLRIGKKGGWWDGDGEGRGEKGKTHVPSHCICDCFQIMIMIFQMNIW